MPYMSPRSASSIANVGVDKEIQGAMEMSTIDWASEFCERMGYERMASGAGVTTFQSKDAVGQVAQITTAIWEVLFEPIWELRNNIMARSDNPTVLREQRTLEDRLKWFYRFSQRVLAQRHRRGIDFEIEEVDKWDRKLSRKKLKMLETAREIYEIECKQRVRGQRVMTEWLEARMVHDSLD